MSSSPSLVLVTGGFGFVAAHCIARLIADGFGVRTTVRSPDRVDGVRWMVRAALEDIGSSAAVTDPGLSMIEFAVVDPDEDFGWGAAVAGCESVLHVMPSTPPVGGKDPEAMTRPARDGVLCVLRAARAAGVRRVVLTSSFGAVGSGHGPQPPRFTEESWTVLDGPGVSSDDKAVALAEWAAWEFVGTGEGPELVTLCPVSVVGPASVSGPGLTIANELIRMLVSGQMGSMVDMWLPIVDVRDVAAAQVAALRVDEAAGQRFIVGSGDGMTMSEIAEVLREGLGPDGRRVPRRTMPSWLIRATAKVVPGAGPLAAGLDARKDIAVDKAPRILGLRPRSARTAVLDSARSMIQRGLVKTDK